MHAANYVFKVARIGKIGCDADKHQKTQKNMMAVTNILSYSQELGIWLYLSSVVPKQECAVSILTKSKC
jgi:hypothetical protein